MMELSRNELLKAWCDELVGRSSKLGELTFPHHAYPRLSISNYKGNRNISDKLWEKFMTNMDLIESKEFEKQVSVYKEIRAKDDIHNQSIQDDFYSRLNTWLSKDKVAKLRMIDLAYVANHDETISNDCDPSYVSKLIKTKKIVCDKTQTLILSMMTHIDTLISKNHVFYIAAKQNPQAYD